MLPRTRLVTINLAEYRGPQPQHHGSAREERSAKPPPRSSGGAFRCGPSAPTPLCHTSTRAKIGCRATLVRIGLRSMHYTYAG